MRILLLVCFLIVCMQIFGSNAYSQKIASPLQPQAVPKQIEIGITFGLGNNSISGIYHAECKDCIFDSGNKLGFTAGLLYLKDFNRHFQWGISLRYISENVESTFIKFESVPIEIEPGIFEETIIPFKNTGKFNIAKLNTTPFIQWMPAEFIILRTGISASHLTNSNFRHTKELLKFKDTLSSGEIVDVSIDGDNPRKAILEDKDITKINLLHFSQIITLGFNFEITQQIYLSPLFEYTIPFTKLLNQPKNFNIINWRISAELRYAFKIRKF
jgi:hypothetical protein